MDDIFTDNDSIDDDIYLSEEDLEIAEFQCINEYTLLEEKTQGLYWELKNYTNEKYLSLCETMTLYDLINFLYPEVSAS